MGNVKELWQTRRCSNAEAVRLRRDEGGKEMKEKEEMKKRLERKIVSGTSQEEGGGDRSPKKAEARLKRNNSLKASAK